MSAADWFLFTLTIIIPGSIGLGLGFMGIWGYMTGWKAWQDPQMVDHELGPISEN